jgi:hypothetical protein
MNLPTIWMNLPINLLIHLLIHLLMILLMILLNPERAAVVLRNQVRYSTLPFKAITLNSVTGQNGQA